MFMVYDDSGLVLEMQVMYLFCCEASGFFEFVYFSPSLSCPSIKPELFLLSLFFSLYGTVGHYNMIYVVLSLF